MQHFTGATTTEAAGTLRQIANHHGELLISAFGRHLNQPKMDSGNVLHAHRVSRDLQLPSQRTSHTCRSYGVNESSKSLELSSNPLFYCVENDQEISVEIFTMSQNGQPKFWAELI